MNELDINGEFLVKNLGDDQFEISITSDTLTKDLDLNVFNMLGQNLLWKTLENEGGTYRYNLNMSYASPGVYLIRVQDGNGATVKRIVVE